jgi:hypothetical protein
MSDPHFVARGGEGRRSTRYLGTERPSRRSYPPELEARLAPMRAAITVLEVEGGALVAGGERLLDEAERVDAACRHLVLDLRLVGAIDGAGAAALQRLNRRLLARGVQLMIAGLPDGSAPAKSLQASAAGLPTWLDADRAIEAAERQLLGGLLAEAVAEVPLAESSLLRGLSPEQCQVVAARLQMRSLEAGETLFTEGDAAEGLFVLTRGSISILGPARNGRTQRYLGMSPGMMLGETAMLDGGGRSATAVADTAAVVHLLRPGALYALEREQPAIAIRLYHNIAHHLSQRLRVISAVWQGGAA